VTAPTGSRRERQRGAPHARGSSQPRTTLPSGPQSRTLGISCAVNSSMVVWRAQRGGRQTQCQQRIHDEEETGGAGSSSAPQAETGGTQRHHTLMTCTSFVSIGGASSRTECSAWVLLVSTVAQPLKALMSRR
jgi:hypothetical protein